MIGSVRTHTFKIGDKVVFGMPNGQQTAGTVVKINPQRLKVRQDEPRGVSRIRKEGAVWSVSPSLCKLATPAGSRTEEDILTELCDAYDGLSPEVLSDNGKRGRLEMGKVAKRLRQRIVDLQQELGREMSERDCWRWEGEQIQRKMLAEQNAQLQSSVRNFQHSSWSQR